MSFFDALHVIPRRPIDLLSAPLTILLICCYINRFRCVSHRNEAIARRRKEDRWANIASYGCGSDWGLSPPMCGHWVSLLAVWRRIGATPLGQRWTPALTLPRDVRG